MNPSRQVARAEMRTKKKQVKKAAVAAAKSAVSKDAAELMKRLALVEEQTKNINAWAMGAIREQQARDEHVDKLTTIAVLLIKEALGRDMSEEEIAALTEALDGPKEKTDVSTKTEPAESVSTPSAGEVPRAE